MEIINIAKGWHFARRPGQHVFLLKRPNSETCTMAHFNERDALAFHADFKVSNQVNLSVLQDALEDAINLLEDCAGVLKDGVAVDWDVMNEVRRLKALSASPFGLAAPESQKNRAAHEEQAV